ncbi:glycosyltransferase [Ketobacter sp. MCCC 1A13808]|uniref:glycosyltransferase n=1 Tax=Ketobacter sp. MCCC 1A13808 TaxID=2602738 RepID=UPI0012EC1DD4|nr:glycosyltransferase [Ketobacter sp. MCCC 1A13808]MVF11730.1 glycosyltransferase [Ketobacter sp. MCCC 1A13808]
MKVCMLLAGDEEGGLEKHVMELANALSEKVDLHLVAHAKYRDRVVPAVQFHAIDLTRSRRNPFLLFELVRTLRRIKPDLVHAHAVKATDLLAKIRHWVAARTVATLHNRRRRLGGYGQMDGVIAINHEIAQSLNPATLKIIPNGMDLPSYTPVLRPALVEEFGLDPELPIFLAMGRLVDAKGFDVLLDAWQGIDASLVILGDGERQAALQTKLEQQRMQARVILAGHRELALRYLHGSDFLVISSRNEGGPYTLVEALLIGVPVLSTRVGMCSDWLPSAYLCETNDASGLHGLVEQALNNPQQMHQEFEPIFRRAEASLTLHGMAQSALDFYRQVLARPQ